MSVLKSGFEYMSKSLQMSSMQGTWADPVDWIMANFYTYDTEKLLELYPVQAQPMRHMLARNAQGKFTYGTIIWSWTKKSAKSTVVAAIVDWFAFHKPISLIRFFGNDLKQADSRVGEYLRESIKIGAGKGYDFGDPDNIMQDFRKNTKISSSSYLIEYPNGSRVEMIPVDPTGEAGGNDDVLVFSELWGWKHKKHLDMWTEATIPPTRYGEGFRLIDTYAGFEGESPILEQLYDVVVKPPQNKIEFPDNKECYHTDSIFSTWVTEHPFHWQVPEYYASEKELLDPKQYTRMHENGWTSSSDSFISMVEWDRCGDQAEKIAPPEDDLLVISLDAGVKKDTFAITTVGRFRDIDWIRQRINSIDTYNKDIEPDLFTLHFNRAWDPADYGGNLKFDGYEGSPAAYLRWLHASYDIAIVTYDEHQLAHFAREMEDELGTLFLPFPQGKQRELSDKYLRDVIVAQRIFHRGDKDDMRQHIKNANRKVINDDRGMRIIKKNEHQPIDLAVGLSMAIWTVKEEIPK